LPNGSFAPLPKKIPTSESNTKKRISFSFFFINNNDEKANNGKMKNSGEGKKSRSDT
jgi:hypothetical protein